MSKPIKYQSTAEQRRDALKALEACKTSLWDGVKNTPGFKSPFICNAIFMAENAGRVSEKQGDCARSIIDRTLDKYKCSTYAEWLEESGDPETRAYIANLNRNDDADNERYHLFVQRERHRWVNSLIKQLKESLK